MTDNGYLIGLIVMAAMTISVLTVGTLASAGILHRRDPGTEEPERTTEKSTADPDPRPAVERRAA